MTSCNHVVNKDSYQYIDPTSAHTLMWKVENAELMFLGRCICSIRVFLKILKDGTLCSTYVTLFV